MYRIGRISELVRRTPFAIREAERTGRIPRAQRDRRGFRHWSKEDLPAIRVAFGVEEPPNPLDELFATLERLAPVIMEQAEALLGDKTIGEAAMALLGEEATHSLVRR